MKKQIAFLVALFIIVLNGYTQAPIIDWQNTIGGSADDFTRTIIQTSDGGYIISAVSRSDSSEDKTEDTHGFDDYWVIKLDASGDIQWENTIGGAHVDFAGNIVQTTDGGYIIAGYSFSDMSDDKTEDSFRSETSPPVETADYWVVKLDAFGVIQWDNTIGGASTDLLDTVFQTTDGGYILGGSSFTDISGDKTENSKGASDYWVVKLDASGVIQWQKTIGGSAVDNLEMAVQTNDGGYILAGYSLSNISGDKTENSNGEDDFWVVKLDASGDILWQNTIGGNRQDRLFSIVQTIDGGYILGGDSDSGISGDKTEEAIEIPEEPGLYFRDFWVVKIDALGIILWENTIGGDFEEQFGELVQTSDGGYLIGGSSDSNISGDKTENSKGGNDFWLVKINGEGVVQWDKTIGGESGDGISSIGETTDGGYILGGQSFSDISGDKTENSKGGADLWIIKLSEAPLSIINNDFGPFFRAYPNPVTGNLNIELGEFHKKVEITIRNVLGQIISKKSLNNTSTLNFGIDGAQGVYFINLKSMEGKTANLRIVKK